jgi:bile acid:Na+ symporter, BASS family
MTLDLVLITLIFVFIIASMLAIGLQVDVKNMVSIVNEKKILTKSIIANFLIIPLIGFIFIKTIPMKPSIEMAFILLSCAPGGLSAIQFISKSKDDLAYAGEAAFLLSTLSVFISPVIIPFFLPKEVNIVVPYFKALWFLVLFLLLPMIIGMLVRGYYKNIAIKLAKPIAILGTLAFIVFIIVTLEVKQDAVRSLTIGTLSLMLLFILLTMLVGWFMGGPKKGTRQILASASSMRNVALCLIIATNTFPDMNYDVPLVAFSALMVLPNMIFTIVIMVWNKRSRVKL